MTRPGAGGRKKVTAENLARLGAERLAAILVAVAATRPDLKRRLRMELAADEGPVPLAAEIDKRLAAFETSRGEVTWRQAPAFLRDLDAMRLLIAERMAAHDAAAAIERLWRFMATAGQVARRYRERGGELDAIFERAAGDLGRLLGGQASGPAAYDLVEAITRNPSGWKHWLPSLLAVAPVALAQRALRDIAERRGAVPGWITLIRQLADAAGDPDAYHATWTPDALQTPPVAARVANRYLAAGRTEQAGDALRRAAPGGRGQASARPDFEWETAWIAYLDQSGRPEDAQEVRWASFERTLSVERAKAFIGQLDDFDDVEAETRAFALAANFRDFQVGLRFLMEWPALAEAGRMIEQRSQEIMVDADAAELWAAKLRRRQPKAAHLLLRKAAAAAFSRRDFKTCDRLSAEAESIAT
jgi:hypothetical protein